MPVNHAVVCWWSGVTWLHVSLIQILPRQGSELSGWTTGHFTEDGFDIFQNFPDLNSVLWDAEDKGMVPKLTPNHHVPIPENFAYNSSVRRRVLLGLTTS